MADSKKQLDDKQNSNVVNKEFNVSERELIRKKITPAVTELYKARKIRQLKEKLQGNWAKKEIDCPYKIWISLTTIPSRIDKLSETLASLVNQTIDVDKINLCVPRYSIRERCDYHIPPYITTDPRITVINCETDYGPSTKLLGSLEICDDPETIIITVDDDIVYCPDIIEKLVTRSIAYPDCAIGFGGWNVNITPTGISFEGFTEETKNDGKLINILFGFKGVLYKKKFFDKEIFHQKDYPKEMFFNDDVWISGYLGLKKVKKLFFKYDSELALDALESLGLIWKRYNDKRDENSLSLMNEFTCFSKKCANAFIRKDPLIWKRERQYKITQYGQILSSKEHQIYDMLSDGDKKEVNRIKLCNLSGCQAKIGIVVPTCNRPAYLFNTMKYLKQSDTKNCVILITDDHSNPETQNLIENFSHPSGVIKIYKKNRLNMFHSLRLGWSLLKKMGVQYVCNLDSDTIVRPDWIRVLYDRYLKLKQRYSKRVILSGFNLTNRLQHRILEETEDYYFKKSIGGINMFFSVDLLGEIMPMLTSDVWDDNVCRYMVKNDCILACTRPSVVQHIGFKGLHSEHREFDFSNDFFIKDGGYYFLPCVDIEGKNLIDANTRDLDTLKRKCKKMKNAVAFNTNGMIKWDLTATHQWVLRDITRYGGLYVKETAMPRLRAMQAVHAFVYKKLQKT